MKLEELRAAATALRDEVKALSEKEDLTADEETRFEAAISEYETVKVDFDKAEARAKQVAEIRRAELSPGVPDFQVKKDLDPSSVDIRTATRAELRDAALKIAEKDGKNVLAPFQEAGLEKLLRSASGDCDGRVIARRMLTTENDAYRSAFVKAMTHDAPAYTREEERAVSEYRAANEGTGSAGGFGIPVLIDPTIILSSGALDAPILSLATIKQITTDAWKGVAAPGASWTFVPEAGVVTDGTPTLAQPDIPVYKASGFIPYSIEVGQDYPGFADEMARVLAQGYTDILAVKSMTGSGSAEPTGVFTSLTNQTTNPAHVTVTTAGTLGAIDVRHAWNGVPERFRPRATWIMNVDVESVIRAFGNGLALSDFTVNLSADGTDRLMGKPLVCTDYAPQFTGTTGAANYLVVGDLSQYYIIQRAGMTVELVQHLFDTTTGRPTGQRGWYAYSRLGADVVNQNALRLLSNS